MNNAGWDNKLDPDPHRSQNSEALKAKNRAVDDGGQFQRQKNVAHHSEGLGAQNLASIDQ